MEMKDIVVGVIGLGMGRAHLDAAISCGATVGGICDPNVEKMNTIADERSIDRSRTFTDYKELLAVSDINTVIIATPDQLHREMVEVALAAGKHVMCEKPLALNREDLAAIIEAGRKSDKKLMVGQICRFTPGFIKAKEVIDSGDIGELFFVESEYAHDYEHIISADNWRATPDRNGVVGGGCHAVDLLRWYVGDPIEVFGYGVHKMIPCVPYDDTNIAVMKFENGVIGKVFVSTGCKRNYTMRTVLYGTKGTIICDNTSPEIQVFKIDPETRKVIKPHELIPVNINNHNAKGEFEVFARDIIEDNEVKMSAYEGAKTVIAASAIVESSKTGLPVRPDYNI